MKNLSFLFNRTSILSAVILFALPILACSSEQLSGQWKGSWDNVFQCHFSITLIENQNYLIEYRWEEDQKQAFQTNNYIGKKINANTILAKNIYIIAHPSDKDRAIALGVFEQQTRMAYLKRVKDKKEKPNTN